MVDKDKHTSLDTDKTVLVRPGASGWDKPTEAHNNAQRTTAGSGIEETKIMGATVSAKPTSRPSPDPDTLKITPQMLPGDTPAAAPAQADQSPEAGYTRIIRPSVSPQSRSEGKSIASADLEKLQKEGPTVGWFVVVKGPGKGMFRPIYYGNNTIGRDGSQRVPLNFGDDAISAQEQAYIRYDSQDRTYLLIPNLAKSNLVSVNQRRPVEPVQLNYGDIIEIGQTGLMFIPLCNAEFDWADVEGQ